MAAGIDYAVTALFVPGDRPDRFEKAVATGADLVIIDLEDAVPLDAKSDARANAVRALAGLEAAVRVNPLAEGGLADAEALAGISTLRAVMLPKSERAEDVAALRAVLGDGVPIIALIETALGVRGVDAIAQSAGVARLAFGALDLSADLNATSRSLLDQVRIELVLASRVAGLAAPLESPDPDFRDLEALTVMARQSSSLGFGGQLCIHPAQVAAVEEGFAPSSEEIAWAQRVVEASRGGAVQLEGTMVDRPVYLRAIATLSRAGAPRPLIP
ncbi:CoA ester lyase [Leifsonia sp. H3M29-4]|uniref:HpcH/HpaI aldolase/citrate lyase family protein n=1 Tax=Salinibacterium metalliresistens TaxID=3031321 RepID=UPI0023DA45A9|nr:CoA ester lyase [Salinibacterium metalliresistens]MDF1480363.1 CoA ester lyase [Salinibacterium metalliresistens]